MISIRSISVVIVLLFLSNFSSSIKAQSLENCKYEFLDIESGLPSNEIYHAFQDDNGIMWFASDKGLIKYTGSTIKVFTEFDGLSENVVLRIYEYGQDTLLIESLHNKYSFYTNDSVFSYPYNDTLQKYFDSHYFSCSFYRDDQGFHHFGSRNGYLCLDKHGQVIRTSLEEIEQKEFPVFFYKPQEDYLFTTSIGNQSSAQRVLICSPLSEEDIYISYDSLLAASSTTYGQKFGDSWFLNKGNFLLETRNDTTIFLKYDHIPTAVFKIRDKLIVGFLDHGALVYEQSENGIVLVETIFEKYSITNGLVSDDNTIWLTTREGGIIVIKEPELEVIFRARSEENISTYYLDGNELFVGNEEGGITWENQGLYYETDGHLLNKIDSLQNNSIYFSSRYGSQGNLDLKTSKINYYPSYFDSIAQINAGVFPKNISNDNYYLEYSFSRILLRSGFFRDSAVLAHKDRISEMAISSDTFYVAHNRGVDIYHGNNFVLIDSIRPDASVLGFESFGNTLLGLTEHGDIYYFNEGRKKSKLDLPMSLFYTDFIIAENKLFTTTNKGLLIWDIIPNGDFKLLAFYEYNSVQSIKFVDDRIYLSTAKEIVRVNSIKNKNPTSSLLIKQIKVNDERISFQNGMNFSYDENDFVFEFEIVGFKSSAHTLKYKLINHNEDFIFTSDNKIYFSSLPPGHYELQVQSSMDGLFYSSIISYEFTINKPFWMTFWFISICAIFLILVIYAYLRIRISRLYRIHRLKESINRLKMQSLIGQLNPHLMFNALNSIQAMIVTQNREKANISLTKFSKYLRKSLNLSKQELVDLREEIEITKQYIELEKLRFEDSIVFSFVDLTNGENIQVPPLLIQPFVENAIKHGMTEIPDVKGAIEIEVFCDANALNIKISDNGPGVENEASMFNGDGLRICLERIKILNVNNNISFERSNDKSIFTITITR